MTQNRLDSIENVDLSKDALRRQFGECLKSARTKAGISIEAISHETKISKQFIVSLEAGLLDELPGRVFGRGFIKSIGRFLKVESSSDLIGLYDKCWQDQTAVKQVNEQSLQPTSHAKKTMHQPAPVSKNFANRSPVSGINSSLNSLKTISEKTSKVFASSKLKFSFPSWLVRSIVSPEIRMGLLASIAGIMVIGIFGRWAFNRIDKSDSASETVLKTAQHPVAVVSTPVNETDIVSDGTDVAALKASESIVQNPADAVVKTNSAETIAQKITTAGLSTELSPLKLQGVPVAFDQTIEIKVTEPVEVKLTIDGKRVQQGLLEIGSYSYVFHNKAELNLSDASSIDVIYNGNSLGSLGSKGRRRKIQFQAKPTEAEFPY